MKLIGRWFKCFKEKETLIIVEGQCHRRACPKRQLFEKGQTEMLEKTDFEGLLRRF